MFDERLDVSGDEAEMLEVGSVEISADNREEFVRKTVEVGFVGCTRSHEGSG
jgi:hypothetical protein